VPPDAPQAAEGEAQVAQDEDHADAEHVGGDADEEGGPQYKLDQIISVCFVPLRLDGARDDDGETVVVWNNRRPGSSAYCRPLLLSWEKETLPAPRRIRTRYRIELCIGHWSMPTTWTVSFKVHN
jgi:hypothetical protein